MLTLSYNDILGDQERHEITADITTEHSESRFGEPVIVLDGDAPLDAMSWFLMDYRLLKADNPEEIEMMKKWLEHALFITGQSSAGAQLGKMKSEKKAKASRENGKKGGRPKKTQD